MTTDALFDVDQGDAEPPQKAAPTYVREPRGALFHALLQQVEPSDPQRGWHLMVQTDFDADTGAHYRSLTESPRRRISRPTLRPPKQEQRRRALTEMGFEIAEPDPVPGVSQWRWDEATSLDGKGTVVLWAIATVRRIGTTTTTNEEI